MALAIRVPWPEDDIRAGAVADARHRRRDTADSAPPRAPSRWRSGSADGPGGGAVAAAGPRPPDPADSAPPRAPSRWRSGSADGAGVWNDPMFCFEFEGKRPTVHPEAFVAPTATLIGDVTVEKG